MPSVGSDADYDMRGRSLNKLAAVFCLVAVCGFAVGNAQQLGQRTTLNGVFTTEQAKSGERLFQARCSPCHGADLHAVDPDAPDLTDDGFKTGWIGKTVANRFRTIRLAMPADAPGSLDNEAYIDIVAYILQFNKMPPGNQKLMPDVDALESIVIASP
jgi:mono/diheme cytochrome c family protein